jgi:hypothetical protein
MLIVNRYWFTSKSVIGELWFGPSPGTMVYTLEPPWREGEVKPRAIPPMEYGLTVRWSPKFARHVPHVEGVPGFTAVEMHIGNFPFDTEGCTLVGQMRGPSPDFIGRSSPAFAALLAYLYTIAKLTNPDSPEKNHIWDCGRIRYINLPGEGNGP